MPGKLSGFPYSVSPYRSERRQCALRYMAPLATFLGRIALCAACTVAIPLHGRAPLHVQMRRWRPICPHLYEVAAAMVRAVLVYPVPAMPRSSVSRPLALYEPHGCFATWAGPNSRAFALFHGAASNPLPLPCLAPVSPCSRNHSSAARLSRSVSRSPLNLIPPDAANS